MWHFHRTTALAFVVAVVGGSPALASDQSLPGSKFLVRDVPGTFAGLFFLTRTSAITVPTQGGPDDPTRVGGSFQIYNPTSGESATFDMPASDWKAPVGGGSFTFVSRTMPSEVKVAQLKGVRLKVRAVASGIALDEPSQGSLGVVLTIGQQRYCALFGGTVTLDRPGIFKALNAPPPASCPLVAGGTTTTTTATLPLTTTTPTTTTTSSTTTGTTSTTTSTTLAPAALSIAPTSFDFGSVPVLATSGQQTFSVTNTGGLPTGALSAPTLTGANGAEFTVLKNSCTGNVLASGAICQVTLEFSPNMTGAAPTQLQFSATPGGTVTANLSGTGTPSTAALSIAPTSYDFGSVAVGTTKSSSSFIVTNTGGSPTGPLSAVTVNGANAAEFRPFDNVCTGKTLGAGGTCTVAVDFTPSAPGVAMAQLQFSASPGGTPTATLTGTGTAPTTTTTTTSTTTSTTVAPTTTSSTTTTTQPPTTTTTTSTTTSTTVAPTTTSSTTTTTQPPTTTTTTSTTTSTTTTTTVATCNPTGVACVLNTDCCSGVCSANVCQ